jgi:transposase-like protein
MSIVATVFGPLVFFFGVLLGRWLSQAKCPDCGASMPLFRSTRRRSRAWFDDGMVCKHCGRETEMDLSKIPKNPYKQPTDTRTFAWLGLGIMIGIILMGSVLFVSKSSLRSNETATPVLESRLIPQAK